ncbi:MAG: peptidoglycan bridge formation glycyltransferase FemA/FemB family protein [Thermomicrobiales bacterium]
MGPDNGRDRGNDVAPFSDSGTTLAPADTWNRTLEEMGGHLLQTWEWGEFKRKHGWSADRVRVDTPAGSAMAQILYRRKGPASMGYIPRGPVFAGDVPAIWPHLRAAIDRSSRAHRAVTTIIELDEPLPLARTYHEAKLVAGPAHIQPGRTVKIPLLDDDALLGQMHQKTRYNVRLAARRGVHITRESFTDEAIDRFYELMTDTAERNAFSIHSRAYYADFLHAFGDRACLLFARVDGHIASVLISARFGREAIYMYGASSTVHRAHGAAFLLQFEAMRWARGEGSTTYDLWGIPEHNPETTASDTDPGSVAGSKGEDWRGLYRFKTGFGGEIVTYPPALERRYVPVVPWLARKLNLIRG